jgi:hypothetical protein
VLSPGVRGAGRFPIKEVNQMKIFSRTVGTLVLTCLVVQGHTAQVATPIQGSLGQAENTCVSPISIFLNLICGFSGGPMFPADLAAVGSIGPLDSGGFYASAAAASGYEFSTTPGVDAVGTPLTSFLVGLPAIPGDGKVGVPLTGSIVIDDSGDGFGANDTIAGTIVLGQGTRLASGSGSAAGSATITESWTSVTHTLPATAVSSATPNGAGGFDYVLGSDGFPTNIFTAADAFASEAAADDGLPVANSPWLQANGGSGFNYDPGADSGTDIVRFGLKSSGPGKNIGGATTAVIDGLVCSDVGLAPAEFDSVGDPVIDTMTDCEDSSVAWGVEDPEDLDAGKLNAGFDNLVLKLSTNASGTILSADAYYTMEYPILGTPLQDNTWVGGTLSFTGSVTPPPSGSIENDIVGTQSKVDGACVAPIPVFSGADCSYNESNPTTFGSVWQGPSASASYYHIGESPFAQCNCEDDVPAYPDSVKVELALTGTMTIADMNDGICDTTDTIAGTISVEAGTRAFAGGPGEQGEETWGAGDVVFPIPETTVDSATPNGAGGCDYVIASAGFPPLLQRANPPTDFYPVDENTDNFDPPFVEPGFYVASSPVGAACGTELNCGIAVAVQIGPGWSCLDNTGGGGACAMGSDGGAHFGGTRATLETVLISVSTDGAGDITAGTIFANNESKVFNVPPDPFNSWDGPLLTFTGTCNNCKLASDDSYTIFEGTGTTTLDIGANDSSDLVDPTTIIITAPPPAGALSNLSAPGDIKTMTVDYTPPALPVPFTEQFEYQVDDGVNAPATATVTVHVETDTVPVANDITRTMDTQGVAPSTLFDSFNGLTEDGNMPGDGGVVTTASAARGASSTNGIIVTYVPGATFFSGTDAFAYTITDRDGDADSGTVTIDILDVTPTANDATATTDRWVPVNIPITYVLGNGALAQHSVTANAENGSCTVNLAAALASYAPDDGFFGEDTCTYTIGDGDGSSDVAEITVTVNFVEDLIPIAVDDEAETPQGQSVVIDVLNNDTLGNPENVVTLETAPAHGSAYVQSDDTIRYFPNSRFFGVDSFQYRLTDTNGDSDVATVSVGVFFVSGVVPIDILPGKEINNINLGAGGRIQVAILSVGEFFDAPALIDPFSLKFGPREANIIGTPSVRDIDHDGDDDLLVKFLIEQSGIVCGQLSAFVTGDTFDSSYIYGFDSVNTFKCRRRPITY